MELEEKEVSGFTQYANPKPKHMGFWGYVCASGQKGSPNGVEGQQDIWIVMVAPTPTILDEFKTLDYEFGICNGGLGSGGPRAE